MRDFGEMMKQHYGNRSVSIRVSRLMLLYARATREPDKRKRRRLKRKWGMPLEQILGHRHRRRRPTGNILDWLPTQPPTWREPRENGTRDFG